MLGLWLASGFGWRLRTPYCQGIHYDLVQGVMWVFFREAKRVLRLDDRHRGPDARTRTRAGRSWSAAGTPGPGDSFMLIHALMEWYDREPRVVLKDTLAWDPAIDVLLQPDPGPVHLARTRRAARTSRTRSRRWPPASTRTTRS